MITVQTCAGSCRYEYCCKCGGHQSQESEYGLHAAARSMQNSLATLSEKQAGRSAGIELPRTWIIDRAGKVRILTTQSAPIVELGRQYALRCGHDQVLACIYLFYVFFSPRCFTTTSTFGRRSIWVKLVSGHLFPREVRWTCTC